MLEKDCAGMRKEKEKMQNDMLHLELNLESARDQLIEANAMCETLEEARVKIERDFKRFNLITLLILNYQLYIMHNL